MKKNKINDNDLNSLYNKVKKFRIAEKITESYPVIVLSILLNMGVMVSSLPLAKILNDAGVISSTIADIAMFAIPTITTLGSIMATISGIPALAKYFETKKEKIIKQIIEISNQKAQSLDNSIPNLTDSRAEQEVREYTENKNNQIVAKVNIFSSIVRANHIIEKSLEEEWEVYLFDKISQGVSDETIKEIIYGLTLLNCGIPIEIIYAEFSGNMEVLEALIHFSPRGEYLENLLPNLNCDRDSDDALMTNMSTMYLNLRK